MSNLGIPEKFHLSHIESECGSGSVSFREVGNVAADVYLQTWPQKILIMPYSKKVAEKVPIVSLNKYVFHIVLRLYETGRNFSVIGKSKPHRHIYRISQFFDSRGSY